MNKKHQPKVSLVFLTWNGKRYTFDLLESLKKINYKNYDIIVVDNGSNDGTQKEFKKKYLKSATLIENKENLGFVFAANIGIREGLKRGSKYILLMNNDMIVKPDFLNILVEAMERYTEVAVAGPKIYYMEPNNMIWSAGCDYHWAGYKSRNQNEIDKGQTEGEKYVDAIDCVLMIRSDVLNKHRLLDSKLFFIHELTEWCLRVQKFGHKCLYVPKSVVWHKVSAAFENNKKESETSTYYNIRNWLLVIKKNKNLLYFLWVLFLESIILVLVRSWRYIKNNQSNLIKTYFIAIWHALINKTPMKLYPYK